MSINRFHVALFIILIFGVYSFFYLCYNKNLCFTNTSTIESNKITQNNKIVPIGEGELKSFLRLAFVSDTHLNSDIFPNFKESLYKLSPSYLIHAGDLTDYGSASEMRDAKKDLDSLNINYLAIPGDHDIAQTSSEQNFKSFFSYPSYLIFDNVKVLLLPNFWNFTPLSENIFNEVLANIESSDIIVSSQPIYVNESNIFFNRYMGSSTAFENISKSQVKGIELYNIQRLKILDELRKTSKPKIIISGDHHRSSNFPDPVNPLINYHILGSLSKYIYFGGSQILQTSLQSNRYSILDVSKLDSGLLDFKITEIEIR
jgi:predicted phosphodiesterase